MTVIETADPHGSGRCVPVARIEAMVRLLGPDEMTPTANRMWHKLIDEIDPPDAEL